MLHSTPKIGFASVLWLASFMGGCDSSSQSNSLEDEENVRIWATTASALAVYSQANGPLSFADGQPSYTDPNCPLTSDDGTTATIDGDCTDTSGTIYDGSVSITRATDGSVEVTFDHFSAANDPDFRSFTTGTFRRRRVDTAAYEFDADLVLESGMTTTFGYSGRIQGDYGTRTTWNGEGEVERDGDLSPTGVVNVSTVDEVVDDSVCHGQPVSGRTSIQRGDQIAVVSYDGATSCDDDQAAQWSLDGDDQGLITGISCSVTAAGARTRGALGLSGFGLLALLGFRVRRNRRASR